MSRAERGGATDAPAVAEPVIEREEVVALLFNLSDIVATLSRIERLWRRTMAKKKLTEAERAKFAAERERMLANAAWTRELAKRAQAKLDAKTAQR